MITLTIKFTSELSSKVRALEEMARSGIREKLSEALEDIGREALFAIKATTPISQTVDPRAHPGALAESTRMVASGSGSVDILQLGYAQYVIEGTEPHDIFPVHAQVLMWYGNDGNAYFSKHVHHPGTKPNDYPAQALQLSAPRVVEILRRTGREIWAMAENG